MGRGGVMGLEEHVEFPPELRELVILQPRRLALAMHRLIFARLRGTAEGAELAEASVRLALSVKEMVAADTLSLTLNGVSLDEEPRSYTPRNGNRGRLHVSGTCESDHCVSCMCSSAA